MKALPYAAIIVGVAFVAFALSLFFLPTGEAGKFVPISGGIAGEAVK